MNEFLSDNKIFLHFIKQQQEECDDDSFSSLTSTSLNFINSIVGSGVIGEC